MISFATDVQYMQYVELPHQVNPRHPPILTVSPIVKLHPVTPYQA
jgi:hypothetical protein